MLLSYTELCELIEQGVIDAPIENVNASSIDITLGNVWYVELKQELIENVVDLSEKNSINTFKLPEGKKLFLTPGQFLLASSQETFNLPENISAEYKLKSSMARNGIEHLNAGWCDAGWHSSKLTLELKNITQYHTLVLRPGMKIGQMIFFKHAPVPDHASYATKGRYNNQHQTTVSKGIE